MPRKAENGYGLYQYTVEDNGIGMSEEFRKHVSKFTVTIPFKLKKEDARGSSHSVQNVQESPLTGRRVLLVEDNEMNREETQ